MEEKEIQDKEVQPTKKKSGFKKVLFLFLFCIVLFYLYIRYVETSFVVVHEYPIYDNHLPSIYDGTKIVHFSDILYGSTVYEAMLEKTVEKINELKADVVVFTGDLFNDTIPLDEKNYAVLKENLQHINATYRKYAVIGNCDYVNVSVYKEIMESAGFIVLENENDLLYFKGNDPLLFIGISSSLENQENVMKAFQTEENTDSYYKIWLHHEPVILDTLLLHNIEPNLLLTGHSLQGLVPLPFGGRLLNQEGVGDYTSSYYENENTKMFVSGGIGTYKFNVRFLNYPSINLYRLYSHL